MTALDEAVLRNMGDEALGIVTACWYSAEIDNPINQKFVDGFRARVEVRPGLLRRGDLHRGGGARGDAAADQGQHRGQAGVHEGGALDQGRHLPRAGVVRPVRQRGRQRLHPASVERKEGRLVNSVIHTYPNVSQFWTYKPEEFLKNPVYSRDYPPAKNLESASLQYAVLGDPDAEQPGAGRAAVPAGGRASR